MTTPPLPDAEDQLLRAIDDAIVEAGRIMDLADIDMDDIEHDLAFEARFHCGVCITRTVMEAVWPAIEDYHAYLRGAR
jgi:hypothetical protein